MFGNYVKVFDFKIEDLKFEFWWLRGRRNRNQFFYMFFLVYVIYIKINKCTIKNLKNEYIRGRGRQGRSKREYISQLGRDEEVEREGEGEEGEGESKFEILFNFWCSDQLVEFSYIIDCIKLLKLVRI